MTIGIHITFFYVEERLKYLYKVLENLEELPHNNKIFIYTNKIFKLGNNYNNDVKLVVCKYNKNNLLNRIFQKIGLIKIKHPFYLTWENRKYVELYIEDFDVQVYLEDDIGFNAKSFEYWIQYKDICLRNGYNLGFLRTELNSSGEKFLTDITTPINKIIELEGQLFLINDNNPYCGFWIYDKMELIKFIKTKEWKFNFKEYNIREKSAIGWHGKEMKRYKETIIPLIKNNNILETHQLSSVHHIPNNYIGDKWFCKFEFPLTLPIT